FSRTTWTTDSRVRMDSPRSPRSASPIQRRYWTGMGSFSPYFCRISSRPAASASVPAITRAGSPGIRRTPVKTIRLMTKRVTTEMNDRWTRNSITVAHRPLSLPGGRERRTSPRDRLVPGDALDPDQTVRDGLVPLEALRERRDVVRVVEVDDVAAGQELVHRLPVELDALLLVADLPRLVEEGIDRLVADPGRV